MGEHPLQNSWTFWEHVKAQGGKNYGDTFTQLGSFNTVEGFWNFKNNLPHPSAVFFTKESGPRRLKDRELEGFSMFKTGIKPAWEDKRNETGGEYYLRTELSTYDLDTYFEKLLCGCIGETLDPDNYICGVRLVDKSKGARPCYRLEVWFSTREQEICDSIRANLISCLDGDALKDFASHGQMISNNTGQKRGGSNRNLK